MNNFKRVRLFGITLFLVAIPFFLHSCFTLRMSDKKVKKKFRQANTEVSIKRYSVKFLDYPVRVVGSAVDPKSDIALFFIHGAPGSSQDFYSYLQDSILSAQAQLYSIDRPGYGYSNFGEAEVSVQKQAEIIAAIIEQLPDKKVIVIGHSFGGPIAPLVSLYTPKIVAALMLAPAIDPEHEKIFKIAYLGKWKATKWLVPKAFRVAADEKFSHVEALRDVQHLWSQVTVPVMHYHGTSDVVVPYENIHFSTKVFDPKILEAITLDNENHFLPWAQFELIQRQLLQLIAAQNREQ